eukprot:jgi/Bigna1/69511/fgenesh1_pg.9_\
MRCYFPTRGGSNPVVLYLLSLSVVLLLSPCTAVQAQQKNYYKDETSVPEKNLQQQYPRRGHDSEALYDEDRPEAAAPREYYHEDDDQYNDEHGNDVGAEVRFRETYEGSEELGQMDDMDPVDEGYYNTGRRAQGGGTGPYTQNRLESAPSEEEEEEEDLLPNEPRDPRMERYDKKNSRFHRGRSQYTRYGAVFQPRLPSERKMNQESRNLYHEGMAAGLASWVPPSQATTNFLYDTLPELARERQMAALSGVSRAPEHHSTAYEQVPQQQQQQQQQRPPTSRSSRNYQRDGNFQATTETAAAGPPPPPLSQQQREPRQIAYNNAQLRQQLPPPPPQLVSQQQKELSSSSGALPPISEGANNPATEAAEELQMRQKDIVQGGDASSYETNTGATNDGEGEATMKTQRTPPTPPSSSFNANQNMSMMTRKSNITAIKSTKSAVERQPQHRREGGGAGGGGVSGGHQQLHKAVVLPIPHPAITEEDNTGILRNSGDININKILDDDDSESFTMRFREKAETPLPMTRTHARHAAAEGESAVGASGSSSSKLKAHSKEEAQAMHGGGQAMSAGAGLLNSVLNVLTSNKRKSLETSAMVERHEREALRKQQELDREKACVPSSLEESEKVSRRLEICLVAAQKNGSFGVEKAREMVSEQLRLESWEERLKKRDAEGKAKQAKLDVVWCGPPFLVFTPLIVFFYQFIKFTTTSTTAAAAAATELRNQTLDKRNEDLEELKNSFVTKENSYKQKIAELSAKAGSLKQHLDQATAHVAVLREQVRSHQDSAILQQQQQQMERDDDDDDINTKKTSLAHAEREAEGDSEGADDGDDNEDEAQATSTNSERGVPCIRIVETAQQILSADGVAPRRDCKTCVSDPKCGVCKASSDFRCVALGGGNSNNNGGVEQARFLSSSSSYTDDEEGGRDWCPAGNLLRATPDAFKIMSYNVFGRDRYQERERLHRIVTEIADKSPHFITLQDAHAWVAEGIKNSNVGQYYQYSGFGENGNESPAGLMILSKFPLKKTAYYEERKPGQFSSDQRAKAMMILMTITVHVLIAVPDLQPQGTDSLVIATTSIPPSATPESKASSLDFIFSVLSMYKKNVVLTGDFNFDAGAEPESTHIPAQYADIWSTIHVQDRGATWDPTTNMYAMKTDRSLPS